MDDANYLVQKMEQLFRVARLARERIMSRQEISSELEAIANELMSITADMDTGPASGKRRDG